MSALRSRPGVMMLMLAAIMGWFAELNLNTPLGSPPPETEDGIWEDWCNDFPGPRWTESPFSAGFMELDAQCANFGGALRWRADESLTSAQTGGVIFQSEPLNLDGQKLTVFLDPPETLSWFWFQTDDPSVTDLGSGTHQPVAWFEVGPFGGGGSLTLYMQIDVGSTFESESIPYNSTEHVWLRILHEEATDTVRLQTAPHCGTWTTHVEGVIDGEWAAQRIAFRIDADGADPVGEWGVLGQVYISPTSEAES